MNARDIMTKDVICCTLDATLKEVARLMADNHVGEIPVLENLRSLVPVGVITDRDIACRGVAMGRDPTSCTARECMTRLVVTVSPEDSVEECCRTMQENQIRRLPVVDKNGLLCGFISQADLARCATPEEFVRVTKEVSRPSEHSSRVH